MRTFLDQRCLGHSGNVPTFRSSSPSPWTSCLSDGLVRPFFRNKTDIGQLVILGLSSLLHQWP
jgi:hypothetical protein